MRFKTLILTNTSILVLCTTAVASNATSLQTPAPEKCVLQLLHDRQEPNAIQSGEILQYSFGVKNLGTDTVRIAKVLSGGCGCVKPSIKPKVLQPGQLGKLYLTIDSRGRRKAIHPLPIMVQTEDQQLIKIEGELEIKVNRNIFIAPPHIPLGEVVEGQRIRHALRVHFDYPFDPNKLSAETTSPNVDANIVPVMTSKAASSSADSIMKYEDFSLNVAVKITGTEKVLNEKVSLIIREFQGRDRTFQIPISGRVVPLLRAIPERLFLGYIKPPATVAKQITIKHEKLKHIQVAMVNCPRPATITHVKKKVSPSEQKIDICINIEETNSTVGEIPITFTVVSEQTEYEVIVPCVYVSSENTK